jgi:hypothetical protein
VVLEKKLQKEIPNYFKSLSAQANPKLFMKAQETETDLVENVQKSLKETAPLAGNGTKKGE